MPLGTVYEERADADLCESLGCPDGPAVAAGGERADDSLNGAEDLVDDGAGEAFHLLLLVGIDRGLAVLTIVSCPVDCSTKQVGKSPGYI